MCEISASAMPLIIYLLQNFLNPPPFPIFAPFKERVMFDICCIGHITLDRVITPSSEKFMAGGTSFYFSNAIRQMEVKYKLITALAETEKRFGMAPAM